MTIHVGGDLCYNPDLSEFHNTWNDINNGKEFACVIGNNDTEEDGNPQYSNKRKTLAKIIGIVRRLVVHTTLLLGLDTNGDQFARA